MSFAPSRERALLGLGAWSVVAALWGAAEATLFFIVPDVLLSYAALRGGVRIAFLAAGSAVIGALLGGAAMYLWGQHDAVAAEAMLDRIPAISADAIARVGSGVAGDWASALFAGAFSGIPYKIFAVEAGRAGLDMGAFLAVSAPARYARFAATVLVTVLAQHTLERFGRERWSMAILTGFWLCFYALYFAVMSAEP